MKSYATLQLERTRRWWTLYWRDMVTGAAVGAVLFLLIYGFTPLNPCNDGWIYNGYIEDDIIQSYAGWQYLRQDAWHLPLCWANNVAAPTGASMAYTDVYPLAAVFFKLLGPLLPATFQYFGIVNFLNFCLQGAMGCLLLRLFSEKRSLCALGSILFCLAPVFVERVFRHTALGSQWVILLALYLYFWARRTGRLPAAAFVVLCCLAPAVHAYFLPMVFALLAAALLEDVLRRKKVLKALLCFILCTAGALLSAWGFGVLMPQEGAIGGSYGVFTMNLNALWNPTSFDYLSKQGFMNWSSLIPISPQLHYNYDGFNYLAVLAVFGAVLFIKKARAGRHPGKKAGAFLKSHLGLVLACAVMTLFALSNVISWNAEVLFCYPLPGFVTDVCGIFRSSGRIFWPVGYLILLAVCTGAMRLPKKYWMQLAALLLLAAVQTADLWPALQRKHADFAGGAPEEPGYYNSETLRFFAENYENVFCLGTFMDYRLSAAFVRYHPQVQTNLVFFNRGTYSDTEITYMERLRCLLDGGEVEGDTLYLCSDEGTYNELMSNLDPDARGYRTDGPYYFICIPKEGCPLTGELPETAGAAGDAADA
ncbi:MAG: DUF6311 domain-containing protein [Oscillospiraceae bacterium]|nr:DUF6311 domain-containing protein [Oscillospiraceae bacterium]